MQTPKTNSIMRSILLLIFVLLSCGASAMAFFDGGKTCVFSKVNATLTLKGEPLKNVKVIRRWEWKKLEEETTTTDESGAFAFPAVLSAP